MKGRKRILFFLIYLVSFSLDVNAQSAINDCSGAIQICGDGAISSNANGVGTQELTNSNNCASQEHNSIWLKIDITKAGTLGFNLKPKSTNITIDYDFFIFGPNASCEDIGFAIRCSTTNPQASGATDNLTGMRDSEIDENEGPGPNGNSYVRSLDVEVGDSYFIVIDRPIGNSPFDLEWTGTSTVGGFPFPDGPSISKPEDLFICNSNGVANFNLYDTQDEITTQANTSTTYHSSLANAIDNAYPLQEVYTSDQTEKSIYARVQNDITGCSKIVDFNLYITDGPAISEEVTYAKCDLDFTNEETFLLQDINSEILGSLDISNYNVEYYSNYDGAIEMQSPLPKTIDSEGELIYARVWEKDLPDCYTITTVNLELNTPPILESYSVNQTKVNSNSNTIELNFDNNLGYEFSIGNIDGPYQTETTFNNVSAGFQTLYIRDMAQCAILTTEVAILGYDNFFTPNNDGVNDYWTIKGLEKITDREDHIFLFNRYGQLLIKINPYARGWDGTINGKTMPADDYWFRVKLKNGQEFKGHISLLR